MWVIDGGWISLAVASFFVVIISVMMFGKEIKLGKVKKVIAFNFVFLYLMIVVSSYLNDWYLQNELAKFDLDGDGFFSQTEMTARQQELFNQVMQDTGNNFVLITSAVYSAFVTFLLFLALKIRRLLKNRNK